MKRSLIVCVALTAVLLMTAVGCQRESGQLSADSSVVAPVQQESTGSSGLSDGVSSQSGSIAIGETSSQIGSSTVRDRLSETASNGEASSLALSNAEINASAASSYIFRPSLSEQLKEIDENNIPETIFVRLTPSASGVDKPYDESFFGCDVTIVNRGNYGGGIIDSISRSSAEEPIHTYFWLKVNQPGMKGLCDVLQVLDQREDIEWISLSDSTIIPAG